MKIGQVDLVGTAKRTFKEFRDDDLQGLAAEATYHLLFSIVPLLIFLAALTGYVGQWVGQGEVIDRVTNWLRTGTNLPPETVTAVIEPVIKLVNNQSGGFLSIGAVLALWSGKNALGALMKSLNVAFDVKESRPWWKKTAIAMGLTVALGLAIVAASLFFLAGSFIGDTVFGWLGLGDSWATVWSLLRWPLIFVLLSVALAFFYWAGPNVAASFAWLTPGSVVAVVLWVVATLGLSLYFRFFAGYVSTYGPLGGVLAFVFWLYLMSLILLLGGELNAVLAHAHDPATQQEVADPDKAISGVGAKRRGAAGKETAPKTGETSAAPLPPAEPPPMPAFARLAAGLPSAEQEARDALAAEGTDGSRRRFQKSLAALGASVAAVFAALVGSRRR